MGLSIRSKIMGTEGLVGFEVIDQEYNSKVLRLNDVIALAEQGMIDEYRVLSDGEDKYIIGENQTLDKIPEYLSDDNNLTVISRIVSNGETLGFMCINSSGTRRNYKVDKFWQLVKNNHITNVRAMYNKDKTKRILVGVNGTQLDKLLVVEKH